MDYLVIPPRAIQTRVTAQTVPQSAETPPTSKPFMPKSLGVGAPGSGNALLGLVNQTRISAQRLEEAHPPTTATESAARHNHEK